MVKHTINAKQREKLLRVLSEECEERGTDATGYGYFVEEIEEMLYQPGVIEEALCEILNECAYNYCGEF